MAREIQLTMLPQQYPPFQGERDSSAFTFTHRYLPTGSVGGDFFSVSAISDYEAAVFICDVAGHGVRSALVTAMVRALVEELKPLATEPGRFLTKLNADLHAILKHTGTPMLTTAFYLVANWREGVMRYANAGHPKPLHIRRRAGKVAPLANASRQPQRALGLFEDASYETGSVSLEEQDAVMLFTDGLYEVQNKEDALYTQELLVQAVERRMQLHVGPLFDELLDEIRNFSAGVGFTDDVCLVGMEHAV
jgi:serine phosphatase RsbU (regulator of sigma subunit)